MNGDLAVESAGPGQGAAFTLKLPAGDAHGTGTTLFAAQDGRAPEAGRENAA